MEAFLSVQGNDADSKQTFKLTEDGYSAVQPEADFAVVLRHEILSWFGAVRFWEKSSNWLQVVFIHFYSN